MLDKIRVFNGSPVVIIDDEYYSVDIYHTGKILEKNVAYMIGDFVYIYYGEVKGSLDGAKPGIYIKNGRMRFIDPKKKDSAKYSIDNVTTLDTGEIFRIIEENKDKFIQPEDIEIINNNAETYIPTIKEDDDFLKFLVKRIIIDKKINLRNYRDKFPNEYALNNMKSGLNRSTKMTVTNFKAWCEILGIKWSITIEDNGDDTINPLPEPITITSNDF